MGFRIFRFPNDWKIRLCFFVANGICDDRRHAAGREDNGDIHRGKDDSGNAVKQESLAKAVKVTAKEDHLSNVHDQRHQRRRNAGEPHREQGLLVQREGHHVDAHRYAEEDEEQAHQDRGKGRYLNISVAVEGGKACPDAHSQKGCACRRLKNERFAAACVASFNHAGKAVKAIQDREDENHRDDIKMKLEGRAVFAHQHVNLCPGPVKFFGWNVAHIHLPAFESDVTKIERLGKGFCHHHGFFQQELKDEKQQGGKGGSKKQGVFFEASHGNWDQGNANDHREGDGGIGDDVFWVILGIYRAVVDHVGQNRYSHVDGIEGCHQHANQREQIIVSEQLVFHWILLS